MLTIDLKEQRIIPALMMVAYTIYATLTFYVIDEMLLSYLNLASSLTCTLIATYLILRKKIITRLDFVFILYFILIAAVTMANGLDLKNWIFNSSSLFIPLFLFDYYKENPKPLLIGAAIGFSIAIYIGAAQIITHPDMWILEDSKENKGYLLGGNYNQVGCRLIVGILTNIVCLKISRWFSVNIFLLCTISIAILLMVQSMTSLSCIIIFLLVSICPNINLQRLIIWSLLIFAILFEVFVCFSGKGLENNEFATWIIVDVLGKDITFTNRTDMWDSALRVIAESPIWGWGNPDEEWYVGHMSSHAVGAHNLILTILIYGGIMALALYITMLVMSLRKLFRSNGRMVNCVFASITMVSFMMLMEVYPINCFMFLFIIAYHYNAIFEPPTNKLTEERISI